MKHAKAPKVKAEATKQQELLLQQIYFTYHRIDRLAELFFLLLLLLILWRLEDNFFLL